MNSSSRLAAAANTSQLKSARELVFRPFGACSSPAFYPQLTLWAEFLRHFAAKTGNFVPVRKHKSSSRAASEAGVP
jgi:hypothetical protein